MTIDPNGPAFPPVHSGMPGISTRTYLAGLAMQGLAACPDVTGTDGRIAASAVAMADALIAALNQPT